MAAQLLPSCSGGHASSGGMQVSRAVKQQVSLSLGALAAVIAAGVAIHLLYLAFNITAVNVLRLGGPGPEGEPRLGPPAFFLAA